MKDFKPKTIKYKKYHNNMILRKLKKKEFKHFKLVVGTLGLKCLNSGVLNSIQISACVKNIAKICKRQYKLWLYCIPNMHITAKAIGVRMGKGIGAIKHWVYIVRKNNIFLELIGKYKYVLLQSLKSSKKKIPLSTKIIVDIYKSKWKHFKKY